MPALLALAAGTLAVVGAFLPWTSDAGEITVIGINAGALALLVIGLGLAVVGAGFAKVSGLGSHRLARIASAVASFALLYVVYVVQDVVVSPGPGLYAVALAGVLGLISGLRALDARAGWR